MPTITERINAMHEHPLSGLPVAAYSSDDLREVLLQLAGGSGGGEAGPAGGGRGVNMSLPPYSADKTGASPVDGAVAAALADGHRTLYFPAGTYRWNSELEVAHLGLQILGEGRYLTIFDVRGARWATFSRATPPGGSATDTARVLVADIHFAMSNTSGGIKIKGHEPVLQRLKFSRGDLTKWCIELENVNEFSILDVNGGTGGLVEDLSANGLYVYGTDDDFSLNDQPYKVNYGDGHCINTYWKLKHAGQIGFKVEHLGRLYDGNKRAVMNNILFARCHVNAPGGSLVGTGFLLRRTMRCALVQCDVEQTAVGFRLEGDPAGGTPGAAGACRYIWFIGSTALGCQVGYEDTNGSVAGSAMECAFIAPQGFNRLPSGTSSNSTNRMGEGDTILSGAVWLPSPSEGSPAVQLRAANPTTGFGASQLVITTDYNDSANSNWDGHPKKRYPRKGLILDVGSTSFAAIKRSIGISDDSNARLIIGNGDAHARGRLRGIDLADPIFQTPLTSEPSNPYQGSLCYITNRLVMSNTADWRGPGWYGHYDDRLEGAGSAANAWLPAITRPGLNRVQEINVSTTIGRSNFGAYIIANHASTPINITINANVLRTDEGQPDEDLGGGVYRHRRVGAWFLVERKNDARVVFVAGSDVTLDGQDGVTEIPTKHGLAWVQLRRTSLDHVTAYIRYFGARPPGALAGRRQVTTNLTLSTSDLGKIVRVSSTSDRTVTVPTGLLPAGAAAARVYIAREGSGEVTIAAGSGMSGKFVAGKQRLPAQNSMAEVVILDDDTFWINGEMKE